ncbi:MAG: hypothetical protein PHW69_09565, partial [Elusimicrobiaceae bacterium]|nr:hypothetical protein [Elusimicrobiaceae bacterium]
MKNRITRVLELTICLCTGLVYAAGEEASKSAIDYSGRVCLDQYQALAKVIKFILHASLLFSVRAASPKYTSAGFL